MCRGMASSTYLAPKVCKLQHAAPHTSILRPATPAPIPFSPQSALLQVPWPPELLEHPRCRPRPLVPVGLPAGPSPAPSPRHAARPSAASSTPRHGITAAAATTATTPPQPHLPPTSVAAADQLLVLFRGLSVRCGVATGVPATIREHPLTRRMQYTGTLLRLATSIADSGSGGQVRAGPGRSEWHHGILVWRHRRWRGMGASWCELGGTSYGMPPPLLATHMRPTARTAHPPSRSVRPGAGGAADVQGAAPLPGLAGGGGGGAGGAAVR